MKWRRVSIELPLDMKDVLIFDNAKGINMGYYYEKKQCFIRQLDGYLLGEVTHWMEIPGEPMRKANLNLVTTRKSKKAL